jgi:hypothetical protein
LIKSLSKLQSANCGVVVVVGIIVAIMALPLSLHHERELKTGVDRVQESSKRLQSDTGVK